MSVLPITCPHAIVIWNWPANGCLQMCLLTLHGRDPVECVAAYIASLVSSRQLLRLIELAHELSVVWTKTLTQEGRSFYNPIRYYFTHFRHSHVVSNIIVLIIHTEEFICAGYNSRSTVPLICD